MKKETFYKIIESGVQAPSGDNLQPWKIIPGKNLDSFTLKFTQQHNDFFDVKNSATYFSSGAFLENVKISGEGFGYKAKIEINKDSDSEVIALVKFKKTKKSYSNLSKFIFKRATLRTPFNKEKLPESFFKEVKSLLDNRKITLRLFSSDNSQIQQILYKSDIIRSEVKGAHETLASNIRISKDEISTKTGLDYRTLGIPFMQKTVARLLRSWKFSSMAKILRINRIMAKVSTKDNVKNSSSVGILTIDDYSKESFILAGMLIERFWLILTKYRAYLQPFASLSFFIQRISDLNGEGFSKEQIEDLVYLKQSLFESLNLDRKQKLCFIFRFGLSNAPRIRSLRKSVKDFITQ